MTPAHHPSEELLLDHAAGALAEAPALLVATHLALCPRCRAEYAALEAVGAEFVEAEPAPSLEDDVLQRTLARLGEQEPAPAPSPAAAWPPRPLRDYLPVGLDALPWRRRMSGVWSCPLEGFGRGAKVEMLRIAPGRAVPHHTHRGQELTLVLEGGYTDELGSFARGDVSVADESVRHRPQADPGPDCICLTVVEGALRFSGLFGLIANPLQRL